MRTKLQDLDPKFVMSGGEGITDAAGNPVPERRGVGLSFRCPCGKAHDEYDRVFVHFRNPLDGGPSVAGNAPSWERTGDTFDTITLTPSIQRIGGCGWHGFVTNGEAHE